MMRMHMMGALLYGVEGGELRLECEGGGCVHDHCWSCYRLCQWWLDSNVNRHSSTVLGPGLKLNTVAGNAQYQNVAWLYRLLLSSGQLLTILLGVEGYSYCIEVTKATYQGQAVSQIIWWYSQLRPRQWTSYVYKLCLNLFMRLFAVPWLCTGDILCLTWCCYKAFCTRVKVTSECSKDQFDMWILIKFGEDLCNNKGLTLIAIV